MTPRLTVRRESLGELAADQLGDVVGGGSLLQCSDVVCLADLTGYYPSINAPCTTD